MNPLRSLLLPGILLLCGCTGAGLRSGERVLLRAELPEEGRASRSTLPGTTAFENSVTEVTFIAYNASTGLLEGAVHTGGSSATLTLDSHATHHIYALANMGDWSNAAPVREALVPDLSYTIPSYDSMSSAGMPMAGSTECGGAGPVAVSVRRLLAKVIVTVDRSDICDGTTVEPFDFGGLSVQRAARRLRPFASGGSRALDPDDLFPGSQEPEDMSGEDPYADSSTQRVLYIPENCQGALLEDGGNAFDKSLSNPILSAQESAALCTYITFEATKNGQSDGVDGDLSYRFFPGADATSNFSLEGGKVYLIDLVLTWDGMFVQGNWMVTRTGWSDTRLLQVSDDETDGYASAMDLFLPAGISGYPVFVYYSPEGDAFSFPGAPHLEGSYGFELGGDECGNPWGAVTDADGVAVTYEENLGYCSEYLVDVPQDAALLGTVRQIVFRTREKARRAVCNLAIVSPVILLDRNEVVKGPAEYGDAGLFQVSVIGGNVPESDLGVVSSSADLRVTLFDSGTATATWLSPNNESSRRSATLTFSGLGASAVCTVYQNGRSSFDIDPDADGGGADNDY